MSSPKFHLGRMVATPDALRLMAAIGVEPLGLLSRHIRGDWGDVSDDDKAANDRAVVERTRIFSAYQFGDARLWVITEADRSSTCILRPEDY